MNLRFVVVDEHGRASIADAGELDLYGVTEYGAELSAAVEADGAREADKERDATD